ncbi:MAG: hypothetical protein GX871_09115 [Microbacteriaceae bacterium]|nr:hypothetical protein [Microbacteriaceae bacterium]
MSQPLAVAVMLGVAILILGLMLWGWTRRRRRDAGIIAPFDTRTPAQRTDDGGFTESGLYVASTAHGAPLERLAIAGLAFRTKAAVTVSPAGVAIDLAGERPVLFTPDMLVGVDRATWAVGRVVEPDGLVLIAWRTALGVVVDSYLRLHSDPRALIARIAELVPTINPPASPSTESTE